MIEKVKEEEFITGSHFNEVVTIVNELEKRLKELGGGEKKNLIELHGLSAIQIRELYTLAENRKFAEELGIEHKGIKEKELSEKIYKQYNS